jgi:hypothetical protein
LQIEAAHVGNGLDCRADPVGPLLVKASRQRSEPLLPKDVTSRGRGNLQLLLGESVADVLDRVVDLAKGDDLLAHRVVRAHARRTTHGVGQEELAGPRVAAKLVAQHAERTGRVAERPGCLSRRAALQEEGAQRLVLALASGARLPEEVGGRC